MSVIDYVKIRCEQYKNHNIFGDLPQDAPIRLVDIFEWILENGKTFDKTDMGLADAIVMGSRRIPEVKSCYHNALLVRHAVDDLKYFEGWWAGIIPVEHAWNVVDDTCADVTLTIEEHRERGLNESQEYFGIQIPWDWMWEQVNKDTPFRAAGTSGPFLYDYALEQIQKERNEEE